MQAIALSVGFAAEWKVKERRMWRFWFTDVLGDAAEEIQYLGGSIPSIPSMKNVHFNIC